jgi:mannose-6-phosphate isomerase-like protein (cupin superfamily)
MNAKRQSPKFVKADEGRRFSVFGSSMLYKATAEDTGGAFSLALETTAPHGGLPLHVHRVEDEAMYILDGEYEIQCGEEVFRATSGAFVFLPRGIPNRYQNLGDMPGRFLHLTSPGGFEKLVEQTSLVEVKGPSDMEKIMQHSKQYGVDFL